MFTNSTLKITSFHKNYIQNFVQKLKILCYKKYLKNFLIYKGSKTLQKKSTLLKSPHVYKKARDQVEVQHISHFFKIKSHFNFLFFILSFKKYNNTSISLDYKHSYSQNIYYFPNNL